MAKEKKIIIGNIDKDQLAAYVEHLNQLAAAVKQVRARVIDLAPPTQFCSASFIDHLEADMDNLAKRWKDVRRSKRRTLAAIRVAVKEV
ncbi:MAG TPA: hypothetical protein VJI15_01970 [Candidatus Nanoarchaeia archaeon]|nr:hypothetical protein [Candidatus Nanoarchaeia archaeon]